MAELSTLFYKLMPFAPGLSEVVAERFMLEACREFCRDTMAITSDLVEVLVQDPVVTVDAPTGLESAGILRITHQGRTLWSKAEQAVDAILGNIAYESLPEGNSPQAVIVLDENRFRVVPGPSENLTFAVRIAVAPTATATEVPDELVARWYDAIVSGALKELLMHPGQQYTNVNMAAVHAARYQAQVVQARIKVNTSDSRHGTRVVGPRFI